MTSSIAESNAGPTSAPAPFPLIVTLLVALNLLVYLAQLVSGVDWMAPTVAQLISWGANVAPYTLTGEAWRLLTSMFLHIGFIHIALNMYLLIALGPYVEREFGKLRFSMVYLLSGLFGSIVSALWHGHYKASKSVLVMDQFVETSNLQLVVAAGASGALMGICGAFLGRMLTSGVDEQDQNAVGMKGPLVQTIAINLVMGFLTPGIDNACHIGGLVGGFVVGVGLSMLTFSGSAPRRLWSMVAMSAASLGLVWWLAGQPPSQDLLRLKTVLQSQMAEDANKAEALPDAR